MRCRGWPCGSWLRIECISSDGGWIPEGSFSVLSLGVPQATSVVPYAGSGTGQRYSFVMTDLSGSANLLTMAMLFNNSLNFNNACSLVWDSLQFLTPMLLQNVVGRLHRILRPGSSLLAVFHADERVEDIPTWSYRIQDRKTVVMAHRTQRRPAQVFNNRSLEKLFQDFSSVKFFLTRDHLREVLVRR